MNKFLSIALLVLLSGLALGQKPARPQTKASAPAKKPPAKPKPAPGPTPVDPAVEKARMDEALAQTTASEKAAALSKFLIDFPVSDQKSRVLESLVTARAILGDEKLQANDNSAGIALFKLAVEEAPTPIPEKLFNEIVSKFPANLFYRDQRAVALEIAEAIEKKAAGNAKQLLNLATFYLGIESGSDAKRLAEAAIVIDPLSATAYQTLGLSHRLNFDLEESAKAYSKAMELDGGSVASKRSLAEMKRALGRSDEAAALYREIIAANENDAAARTGLILSLFGSGKKAEAETELTRSLEQNPKNLSLLAGAAYWYAANDSGEKAVELAQKAVELEPRYIWGHIALARGLMNQRKPFDAERVLVMARQYGNFPTLEYEIASARIMSGFYREAIEELQKNFTIKDGLIQTRLGGRVLREENNFADLIAYERRASIFEPNAADDPATASKLKALFEITEKLGGTPDEGEINVLTDEFVKGDDKMKLHRQVYSATILLQKNVALPKVLELVKAAVGNTDAGLDVTTPAAAVMASELYESRTVAFARNEIIVVPEVPRQTLSAILRGRIEELTGWTLYQQRSYPEAVVRLRRAISVLPDKSAWWRSSMWRLGAALEADGKDKEALDRYIQSYKTDRPNVLRYGAVEALYKKVHGSTDGLEAKIGPNPLQAVVASEPAKPSEKIATAIEPVSPKIGTVKPTVREVQTKAPFVGIPRKVAEKVQPKVEETVTPDKQTETKAQVTEPAAKISEPIETKTENIGAPDRQSEPMFKVPDVVVKTTEIIEPKAESPTKAIETSQPSVDLALQKKDDEPKMATVEPPAKDKELSLPKAEDTKTEIQAPEIKIEVAETPKPEPSAQVLPVVEQVKKQDTQAESKPETTILITNDKPVEKSEAISPQPQPAAEVPAQTGLTPTEPKNLLRDPLDPDPEPKIDVPAEKPADSQQNLEPEKSLDNKPTIIVSDPIGDGKKVASTRDLFEPVIIRIPSASAAKSANKDLGKPTETIAETEKKLVDDSVSSGASRVRVVDGKEIKSDSQCSLEFSQETVSLINGGGSLGLLVSLIGEGDFKEVVAASSSPRDVEVRAEPAIAGMPNRRFYLVKSVSTAIGVYQVIFESGCGKKEIPVRVR